MISKLSVLYVGQIELDNVGLDQVMAHWAEGMGPKEFREQLTGFAREVMTAFPGAR